jgi:hypothetical protein
MSASGARRPLPALAFLIVLSVLTGVVWWRVLHRNDSVAKVASPAPTPVVTCSRGRPIALPAARTVTVQVLNGAGRDGLAASIRGQLVSRGFSASSSFATNPTILSTVGEIHYGTRASAAATLLSFYVPGGKLVRVSRADGRIDLVLGTGFKALATPAVVSKGVARAKKPC